jgi:UDP-glucuronate 4-epimerase
MDEQRILVTGAAGFIGAHAARELARLGHRVHGCDNFNSYYDPRLKRARVDALLAPAGIECSEIDLAAPGAAHAWIAQHRPDVVLHLAAQPGVRQSIVAPIDCVVANVVAHTALLDACAAERVGHLLYASSSSVYGSRDVAPFREDDRTDRPVSLYAASKKAGESIAHAYAAMHGLPCTGLRFFTVYGPWGRPDMAYYDFAHRLRQGRPVQLFGRGELLRDFTCIDDVVQAVCGLIALGTARVHDGLAVPARVVNVGHCEPVQVLSLVRALEAALGLHAHIEFAPMAKGDVPMTCADDAQLRSLLGGAWAHTPLDAGIERFARWFEAWEHAADAAAAGTERRKGLRSAA